VATLPGIHVEELTRHGDDLLLEPRTKEPHPVVQRRRERRDVAPTIERPVGHAIEAHAHSLEPGEHAIALLAEDRLDGVRFSDDVRVLEERDGGALEGLRPATIEEGAGGGEALDHGLRRERPRDPPTRVPPVLREAIEDHDRISVDVLHVARGALHRQLSWSAAIDVVRVKLVEQQRAVEVARDADPAFELLTRDQLARRVARIREEESGEPAPLDLAPKVIGVERVAAISFEEDRDAGEGLEDVEQLFVRRVVGKEVPEIDRAEARCRARERRASTTGDADVLRGVLRGQAPSIETVVQRGYGFAQLTETRDRCIFLVVRLDGDRVHAFRRAGQLAGLGLTLTEVAPIRIGGREAELVGLARHVDDAGLGNGTERVELVGHLDQIFAMEHARSERMVAAAPYVPASSALALPWRLLL
jgi:hypothetical protein